MEHHLRSDIENLREYLEEELLEANTLLDSLAKQLECYGYDSSDNDILDFIRG